MWPLVSIRLGALGYRLSECWCESLWVRPMLGCIAALALLPVAVWLDMHPDAFASRLVPEWLTFQGTTGEGRGLLGMIVPMTLTGASLLLALSLLLFRMAADEFSPRLLTTFMRSWPVQLTLGLLVALGTFNLAVIYWINLAPGGFNAPPRHAISLGVLLGLAGLVVLIMFVNQLAHWFRTDYVLAQVGRRTLASVARRPLGVGRTAGDDGLGAPPPAAVPICGRTSGYVKARRPELLLRAAATDDMMVRVAAAAGDYVVADVTTLAWVWPAAGHPLQEADCRRWAALVRHSVSIGDERSNDHDIEHGLRQLVDIPCRALYPRGKDPYTAVQAVYWLGTLLCRLARLPLGAEVLHDCGGTARVSVAAPTFADYLEAVCGSLRRVAGYDPSVNHALLRILGQIQVAASDEPQRRALVAEQARLVGVNADHTVTEPEARAGLQSRAAAVAAERPIPILHGDARARRTAERKEVNMRHKWRLWREWVGESLLVLPGLAIVVGVLGAAVLAEVRLDSEFFAAEWLFGGSYPQARETLATIAVVIFDGTTLLFALTIIVLAVIAIQYSPRLVYNTLSDRAIHLVFAAAFLFFVYAMGLLYWMDVDASGFPRLAVSIAVLMVFVALAGLIFMINRLAQWLRLTTVMAHAGRRAAAVIARQPPGIGRRSGADAAGEATAPDSAVGLPAWRSGYLLEVATRRLLALASREDVVVRIAPVVGDYVVADTTPLAWVWPRASDAQVAASTLDALQRALRAATSIDLERIMAHDAAFGIQQQVDAAMRANNPPGKDPYTVVQCVHWLRFLLVQLGRLPLGDEVLRDADGRPRLIVAAREYADYLDHACDDIRRYGFIDTTVASAMLQLLEEAATVVVASDRRRHLAAHLQRTLAAVEHRFQEPADAQPIRARAEKLQAILEVG